MEFDFYNEFKNHSTVELLLITKEPEKYQPAALDAAEKLLRERNVSTADVFLGGTYQCAFFDHRFLFLINEQEMGMDLANGE
jgi:hypothetical protein